MSRIATQASQTPASAGVSVVALKPAIVRTQDSSLSPAERVTKIGRLIQKMPALEKTVKSVEDMYDRDAQAFAVERRDRFMSDLRQQLDESINACEYDTRDCTTCKLPSDPLKFALAVPEFEKPAICDCSGTGVLRVVRKDAASKKAAKRLKYWGKVIDDYHRCCKINAGTSDANQAYLELEAANAKLMKKFGSEKQTSLEGADAEQGVRQGLIDAARRFDPMRSEGATFSTVAYNWCLRNSRARHHGQKRAGVYAPSIDATSNSEGHGSTLDLVQSSEGALGTFTRCDAAPPSLVLDLREQVSLLPDLQRQVVECELAEMTSTAIADKLAISKAKVRKLRAAAFATLATTMKGYAVALDD